MISEIGSFVSALLCFIAEFIFLGVLVTFLVLANYHRAWRAMDARR